MATLRDRTASDVMSGLTLDPSAYGEYTEEQIQAHFTRFKQYDIDNNGVITPENLREILDALEVDCSDEQIKNMIEEVAILSGHANDGWLTFRDYIKCLEYEKEKDAFNSQAEAEYELRLSMGEVVPEDEGEDVGDESSIAAQEPIAPLSGEPSSSPLPRVRMRGSSFALFDAVASTRIQRFETVIKETIVREKKTEVEVRAMSKFSSQLAKFRRLENGPAAAPELDTDAMQRSAIKAKLTAFEAQAQRMDKPTFKKTWRNVTAGSWRAGTTFDGGPAPKKSLADLP